MSRLERERRLRGLACSELGRRVGIEASLLGKVERARMPAYPALRRRLADVLGVPEADLFADLDAAFEAARAVLEGWE